MPVVFGQGMRRSGTTILFDLGYLIQIVIPIALFCALLHPESRDHQRIWFE